MKTNPFLAEVLELLTRAAKSLDTYDVVRASNRDPHYQALEQTRETLTRLQEMPQTLPEYSVGKALWYVTIWRNLLPVFQAFSGIADRGEVPTAKRDARALKRVMGEARDRSREHNRLKPQAA